MADNQFIGYLDNRGLKHLVQEILVRKKDIKTLKINNQEYNPIEKNAEITITASDLGLGNAVRFIGITETNVTDGNTTNSIQIDGKTVIAELGDVVLKGNYEYIWTGKAWERLGPDGTYVPLNSGGYIKELGINGTTITYTKGDSTQGTLTTQDNDSKVTSVDNHYAPTANTNSTLSAKASGGNAASWGSTQLITGVNLKRDAKGHVTEITVDSVKMPANPDTNTTYSVATTSSDGLMSKEDKERLDNIADGANKYTLPPATASTLGGVKIGTGIGISEGKISIKTNYTTDVDNKNYKVQTDDNGNLFVNVPWQAGSSGITGTVQINQGGTGATDAATALANLGAFGALGNAADFGSDLNNFTKIGAVLVSSNVANRPPETGVYGICWNVYGKANTYMEQHYVDAAILKRYIRFKIDNVWRTWAQEYDSNFKPTEIVSGTSTLTTGIAATPILYLKKNGYSHWAIERVGDTDNRLKWHYYDPTTGHWTGNAFIIDSNNWVDYALPRTPAQIEFMPGTSANHGGYIDFHFNSSSADHTSRIIESASGELTMNNYCKLFNSGRQMQLTGSTSDDTAYARFIASTSSGSVALQASTNWGVYDITGSRWLIHVNKSGDSSNVNIAGWASIGSSTQPVYFNDKGRPVACTAVAITNGGTGASNEVTAANNLKVQSLGHGTEIPANANLNTYTTVGNYRCSSTNTGATIANCPVANAFTLQVYASTGTSTSAPTTAGWAYFLQKLTTIGGAQYYRTITFSNSATASFGDWVKIYDSANKPAANDILTAGTGIVINNNQISIDCATAAVSRSKVPYINSDGVMEIGRFVDFHHSNNPEGPDFSARLQVQNSQGGNTLHLPKGKSTAGKEGFLVCGTSDLEIAVASSLPSTVVVGQLLFVYSN